MCDRLGTEHRPLSVQGPEGVQATAQAAGWGESQSLLGPDRRGGIEGTALLAVLHADLRGQFTREGQGLPRGPLPWPSGGISAQITAPRAAAGSQRWEVAPVLQAVATPADAEIAGWRGAGGESGACLGVGGTPSSPSAPGSSPSLPPGGTRRCPSRPHPHDPPSLTYRKGEEGPSARKQLLKHPPPAVDAGGQAALSGLRG